MGIMSIYFFANINQTVYNLFTVFYNS